MSDPVNEWQALLGSDPLTEDAAALLERLSTPAGAALSVAADSVFRALVIRDDVPEPLLAALERVLERAYADSYGDGLGLVRCATLLTAAGRGEDPNAVLRQWVDAAIDAGDELSDDRRTAFALACSAHGCDDALHALLGEPPMAFVPGLDFGPDARGFARYIAAAAAADADAAEVSAAWTAFVAFFPIRLETEGLRWTDLLFAGFAVYVRIAGYEPREVLDAIRDFAREVAAA